MTEPTVNVSEPLQVVDAAPKELTGKAAFERDLGAVSKAITYLKEYGSSDDDVVRTVLALVQTKEHLEQLMNVSNSEIAVDISGM